MAPGLSPQAHIFGTTICARERAGESDERPLRGKAIIPKGKLNPPAVSVSDVENIILINNPSLTPASEMCLCAVTLPDGDIGGRVWQTNRTRPRTHCTGQTDEEPPG